ncbi:MAG: phosphatidylserine decarboxylase family protein [Peptococcaceae bacterium]|nr:phosphatidylserine decarboxylase family protein [Peptococcaceae bacterium]
MKWENFPIASAGWGYLLFLGIATAILFFIYWPLSTLTGVFFIFVAFFFRNPVRIIPPDKSLITSPADGVVMSVTSVDENLFIHGPVKKVNIFLSVFNVHINRSPIAGEVKYINYVAGKFLPAFKSHASEINERNYVGIESDRYKVLVCQITGFIARRIVCYVNETTKLDKGQRFGLIKFGSCTEVFLPEETEIMVNPGDKVKGGETVIGRFPNGGY